MRPAALAYFLWFRGIAQVPATSVAFLGLLSPVSAAVIGWIALGQALSPLQVLDSVSRSAVHCSARWVAKPRSVPVVAVPRVLVEAR